MFGVQYADAADPVPRLPLLRSAACRRRRRCERSSITAFKASRGRARAPAVPVFMREPGADEKERFFLRIAGEAT
jgi:hypothetical protein